MSDETDISEGSRARGDRLLKALEAIAELRSENDLHRATRDQRIDKALLDVAAKLGDIDTEIMSLAKVTTERNKIEVERNKIEAKRVQTEADRVEAGLNLEKERVELERQKWEAIRSFLTQLGEAGKSLATNKWFVAAVIAMALSLFSMLFPGAAYLITRMAGIPVEVPSLPGEP